MFVLLLLWSIIFQLDLLASINQTLEGKTGNPEDMLKVVNEKIKLKLDALKTNTEEEMKKLCINLSNNSKMNSVIRYIGLELCFSHAVFKLFL